MQYFNTDIKTLWYYLMTNIIYPKELCRRKIPTTIDSKNSLTAILKYYVKTMLWDMDK